MYSGFDEFFFINRSPSKHTCTSYFGTHMDPKLLWCFSIGYYKKFRISTKIKNKNKNVRNINQLKSEIYNSTSIFLTRARFYKILYSNLKFLFVSKYFYMFKKNPYKRFFKSGCLKITVGKWKYTMQINLRDFYY